MVASLAVFIGIGMARKDRTNPALTQNYENDVFYENTVNLTENVANPEPEEDKSNWKANPLSGVLEPEDTLHAYYAVIIDNLKSARPQYGISLAPLVYEMPAEGGVTRFLAVFDSAEVDKIGPVRSARPYFIDKAREHGGLMLVHCGGSPEALSIISKEPYPTMNEMTNGDYFFRDRERKAPHNLFVSAEQIVKYAKVRRYSTDKIRSGLKFGFSEAEHEDLEAVNEVGLKYYSGYAVKWKYDEDSELYTRYINDSVHVDEGNLAPVEASNVIVQFMSYKVLDDEGRIEFSSSPSGKSVVLTGGTKTMCKWKRNSDGTTTFEDENGQVRLNEGTTWIQVIPSESGVSYE